MEYTTSLLRWIQRLEHYEIPSWDELPCLDLYMDQVITLMEQYLSVYQKENVKLITPSMINNYVKLGVIPLFSALAFGSPGPLVAHKQRGDA